MPIPSSKQNLLKDKATELNPLPETGLNLLDEETYLQVWRQEVFKDPEFDWSLCSLQNRQHHDLNTNQIKSTQYGDRRESNV